jgi:hypothetical protein
VRSLTADLTFYRVVAVLDVDASADSAGVDALCESLHGLGPLAVRTEDRHLLVELVALAPGAESAAWQAYERASLLPHASVLALIAGLPEDEEPRLILTAESPAGPALGEEVA